MMKNKGDGMKEIYNLVDKLCNDLREEHLKKFPSLNEYYWNYEVGRKYLKVIQNNEYQRSVWGFINLTEFTNKKGVKFQVGDVLKAAGWQTPTLNAPRGNLFDGYEVFGDRKYGPDYLI